MLLHRRQFQTDLDEEMRLHLELRQKQQMESGMSVDAALGCATEVWQPNITQGEEPHDMGMGVV
jgi:hypothetical protein